MNLTFALPDGTCAGLMLPDDLTDRGTGNVSAPCSEKDLAVVFHVPSRQALDRVMTRFGTVKN